MAAHSFVRCQSVLASRDLSWKMGVLELHLIRARSARIAGAHHRRRPLCGWSCRGLWLLLASLQGSLSFGLCKLRPSSIALARLQSAQRLRLHLALLLRFEHLLRVTRRPSAWSRGRPWSSFGPKPNTISGPTPVPRPCCWRASPGAPQARAIRPPATACGASRTAVVRSARAACRHRPEAGPAAPASSRSPPSPDQIGGSTPAGLRLALFLLAAVLVEAARFANHCGRSRLRLSRYQEILADSDAS